MLVYRITGKKHAADFSGTGAALYGGRWNKKGTPVLYSSENKELALLETLVHLPQSISPKLDILTLEIPNNSIYELKMELLPNNWANYPAPLILAELADKWILEGKAIALKVPSCIIQSSHNYILNCKHKEFNTRVKLIERVDFPLDPRLY